MFVCSIYPKPINRFLNRFSLLKTGIVSYNVRLENGHLTSWHRRYLTRDITEKVVEAAESLIHDEIVDTSLHDGVGVSTASGVQTEVVTTGMKKRFLANSALGIFHGESKLVTEGGSHFSSWGDRIMGGRNYCGFPLMVSTLVIVGLYQCSGQAGAVAGAGVEDCTGAGPQI